MRSHLCGFACRLAFLVSRQTFQAVLAGHVFSGGGHLNLIPFPLETSWAAVAFLWAAAARYEMHDLGFHDFTPLSRF
jgi:hypothetical protein